jgi:hypothetical protein
LINLMTTMAMTMMQSTRVTPCHKVNINRTIILDMINIDSCRCRWFEQILQWRRQLPDFRLQASETSHQWMSSTQGYWHWQDLSMRRQEWRVDDRARWQASKVTSKQATMANHKVHHCNERASKQASKQHSPTVALPAFYESERQAGAKCTATGITDWLWTCWKLSCGTTSYIDACVGCWFI